MKFFTLLKNLTPEEQLIYVASSVSFKAIAIFMGVV